MKLRTVRAEPITAGVGLREEAVAPPVGARFADLQIQRDVDRASTGPALPQRAAGIRRPARSCSDRFCGRPAAQPPTLPQRIVILAMVNPEDERVTSQPEYTLSKPSNCPNHRDHITTSQALPDPMRRSSAIRGRRSGAVPEPGPARG